jgi:hypothetical protein
VAQEVELRITELHDPKHLELGDRGDAVRVRHAFLKAVWTCVGLVNNLDTPTR